jgi:hypothetical protein
LSPIPTNVGVALKAGHGGRLGEFWNIINKHQQTAIIMRDLALPERVVKEGRNVLLEPKRRRILLE